MRFNSDGSTFIYGDGQEIDKIFIERDEDSSVTDQDILVGLYRFGAINGIKKSDYQDIIRKIFGGHSE